MEFECKKEGCNNWSIPNTLCKHHLFQRTVYHRLYDTESLRVRPWKPKESLEQQFGKKELRFALIKGIHERRRRLNDKQIQRVNDHGA